ncbi:DUF6901 family protein [Magnetospirillum aberrantis]|uniref:Uncharacterized protein n=1 Tax=Magnetospirillum aberrantis SpK TaxID=908842 RepID=A0A7C9QUP4_9PROT|nr:hypothetical protein [Magnetospirillum aberrantis]NFV81025.1 hypothetical protein [Magnetospirillum aberrantis SpK]
MTAFTYAFVFGGGRELKLELTFDADMRLAQRAEAEWTRLDFHRCSHCPLPSEVGHCPFATGLAPFMAGFDGMDSFERAQVMVRSAQRVVVGERAVQHGLASLIGLIGATSGCPRLDFFRPMARFHLPFSSEQETLVRAISMHLLDDWINGRPLALDDLAAGYHAAALVNRTMADRIRAAFRRDAVVNALVSLDAYAQAVPLVIEDELEELAPLFRR